MADTVATIVADFRAETASFMRAMDGVKAKVGGVEKSMSVMGTAVKRAFAGFLSIEVARRAITAIARETMEAEQSMARLEGVLRATGNVTGHTARELEKLAESLQRTTLFNDEEIRDAIAVLATFRSVAGDAFTDTIKLATDMSAVFGQSLQSSITQLGKAMEDPITGLTSLRRIGVSFSTVQRDLIKNLVEENKLFEAQQEVLKGVSIQIAGTAEAMGKTGLTGSLNSLSDAWGEFLEEAGRVPETGWLKSVADMLDRIRETDLVAKRPGSLDALEIQLKRINAELDKQPAAVDLGHDMARTATGPTREETFETNKLLAERQKILDQMAPLKAAEAELKKVREAAAVEAKRLADAERATATRLEAAEKAAKELKEIEKENIAERLDLLNEMNAETKRLYDIQTDAAIAGLEEMIAAEEKVLDQIGKNAEALQKADDEFAKAEAAQRWVASWGHAFEEMQDRFADGFERLLTGQIRNFRDFAQMILSIWAQTLAQMASAQASAGLMRLGGALLGNLIGGGRFPGTSGMVDSPSLPGMPAGGTVTVAAAPAFNVTFNVQALDGPGAAQLIEQQAPTIVGTLVKALDRSSALRQRMSRP